MREAIAELAAELASISRAGVPFSVKGFVYFDGNGGGDFVQVLAHEYSGGSGDWNEVLAAAISERLPDRDDACMFRWLIEFQPIAGNRRLPTNGGPGCGVKDVFGEG